MSQIINRVATVATAALFPVMAISGVLMFFELGGPLKEAHEWLGLAFVAAVALHLVRNWAGFVKLFSYTRTYVALGLVLLATLAFSAEGLMEGEGGGGNPMRRFVDQAAQAPISTLAPVVGETPEMLIGRLTAAGFKVDSPTQTLRQIAEANDAEMPRLMSVIVPSGESPAGTGEDEDGDND